MKTGHQANPAYCLLLVDPWANNSFYIFKQLKEKPKRNNLWHMKILWNSNFSASNKTWLAYSYFHLFTYYLWLLCTVLQSWVTETETKCPQGLKYLLPGPLQRRCARSLLGNLLLSPSHMWIQGLKPILRTRHSERCFIYIHTNHASKLCVFMKRLNIIKIHNAESESHSEAQLLERTLYTKISKKTKAKLQLTFNCYCPVSFPMSQHQ